ncbi:MAG: hypothetical protein V4584_11740 [Verrucomicrobiota bacterium]
MPEPGNQRHATLRRRIVRLFLVIFLLVAIPLVLLVACQSKLIYFPRPYGPGTVEEWQRDTSRKPIDYTTSQGRQRAFLQGNLKSPRNLWIFCGGNGTVALDWSEWLQTHAPQEDAWLLVDFPGYGDCQGAPSPGHIRENLKTAVPLALREIGWSGKPDSRRLRFFGHSLGSAACLLAATEFNIQRGVLISPFTSTMDMSRSVTGLPLGPLVWHRFDNAERLAELAARGPGEVIIFHGTDDEAIPVTMSRTLATQRKDVVHLIDISGGRHNTIQETNTQEVADALREIGK